MELAGKLREERGVTVHFIHQSINQSINQSPPVQNVFVKSEFVELAGKLREQRGVTVHFEGELPAPPKYQRSVAEMVRFRTDPIGHLRRSLEQGTTAPSEVFHLNGPAKITRQEFTDTVRVKEGVLLSVGLPDD